MEPSADTQASPKELYRRLEDMTSGVFREVRGPDAVRCVAERVARELGASLGLGEVTVRRMDAPALDKAVAAGGLATSVRGPRQSYLIQFAEEPTEVPERRELVLSALGSILSAHLVERAFGSTMRQAEEIQKSLLKQAPPDFDGYDIAMRSVSAEEVGGDLYDFLHVEPETLGLVVGDASGHGLPAALLVRDVVVGLRMGIEKELKPDHTLSRLNEVIHTSALSSCFVSVFYAELEDNGNLFYFNAGHEPPLLFSAGEVTALAYGDTVIGPLTNARFKRHFAHIDHGATLVLYTDGLVERRGPDGGLFGIERLKEVIHAALAEPVEALLERVFRAVADFGRGAAWEDDATLVVVRRRP